MHSKLQQKETLYATQSLELRAAQTYLNTADSAPGSRVIQAVRHLNSEIQNAAAMFAELQFSTPALGSDHFKAATLILKRSGCLGEHLVHSLSACDNSNDPILVQTALQGLLVAEAERCISSFFREDGAVENVVKQLHGVIRENEVHAVSGRWRALSARYLRINCQDPSNSGKAAVEAILDPLTALFVVAGCVSSLADIQSVIANRFASKLHTVLSQALALGTLVHEEVTFTDYEIIHIPAKNPFDPAAADDEYTEDEVNSSPKQLILCTLELGLRQVAISQTSESSSSQKGVAQVRTERLLLKPKIALESAIEKMLA